MTGRYSVPAEKRFPPWNSLSLPILENYRLLKEATTLDPLPGAVSSGGPLQAENRLQPADDRTPPGEDQRDQPGASAEQPRLERDLYQLLARNFGFRTNALPFDMLARALPSIPGETPRQPLPDRSPLLRPVRSP